MAIKGPSESKTSITDHSNGSCKVEYIPLTPGLYEIHIAFGGEKKDPIPGNCFFTILSQKIKSNNSAMNYNFF